MERIHTSVDKFGTVNASTCDVSQLACKLAAMRATVRAQEQALQDAGLNTFVVCFPAHDAENERLGIDFGDQGRSWPVVSSGKSGSPAARAHPNLVAGVTLQAIGGQGRSSTQVANLTLEQGLALVRSIGRPLVLTFRGEHGSSSHDRAQHTSGALHSNTQRGQCSTSAIDALATRVDASNDLGSATSHTFGISANISIQNSTTQSTANTDEDEASGGDGEVGERLQQVVSELHSLLNIWVNNVVSNSQGGERGKRGTKACAHIYLYGSCALLGEVHDEETDVDILVVVPSVVSRSAHFFGIDNASHSTGEMPTVKTNYESSGFNSGQIAEQCILTAILQADTRGCNIIAVPDAFVPCIRFSFDGVPVDLTLATPGLTTLPGAAAQRAGRGWVNDLPPGLLSESVLSHVSRHDISTFRCLNAVRVAHAILKAVPNRQMFRCALSLVKVRMQPSFYGRT